MIESVAALTGSVAKSKAVQRYAAKKKAEPPATKAARLRKRWKRVPTVIRKKRGLSVLPRVNANWLR